MSNRTRVKFANLRRWEALINFLLQFGHLNQQQIELGKKQGQEN